MAAVTTITETYPATCWNCLGEFDAVAAAWCSHDPRLPSKLCPMLRERGIELVARGVTTFDEFQALRL